MANLHEVREALAELCVSIVQGLCMPRIAELAGKSEGPNLVMTVIPKSLR